MFKRVLNNFLFSYEETRQLVVSLYVGILGRVPEQPALESNVAHLRSGEATPLDLIKSILHSEEFSLKNRGFDIESFFEDEKQFSFSTKISSAKLINLIYFCFASNEAIGGVKVILRHSNTVNKLGIDKLNCQIFFPEHLNLKLDWLEHDVKIKKDKNIDPNCDHVIIPEMWTLKYGPMLIANGIKYSIFVQNGFLIFPYEIEADHKKLETLKSVYENADTLLSVSNHIDICLKTAFENISEKIYRLNISINEKIFYNDNRKENIITYMPRKLPTHACWLINQLSLHLDSSWNLVPIQNMNESEVGRVLRKSKIFLSFSNLEGLGLPPLEAALCGNYVIGYTGEAGKDYWHKPVFEEVLSGDLIKYLDLVLTRVKNITISAENNSLEAERIAIMNSLASQFSMDAEIKSLEKFVHHIIKEK